MKVLLIGPHPPPHGGISVHVASIYRQLTSAGVACRVLDTSNIGSAAAFLASVFLHALQGWTLHVHTNGHNAKSWLLAFACGLAGRLREKGILTLHSGILPGYLEQGSRWRRRMAAFTCGLYRQVICVSPEIHAAISSVGVEGGHLDVLPAFLGAELPDAPPEPGLLGWARKHRPLFSTVLFFRPEYGFDLLIDGLVRLIRVYPSLGCIVMGTGEQRAEAEMRVRENGLVGNVLLVGDVDHATCLSLISECDVFLRATLKDGDSISVREALSLGVPVVASSVGIRPSGAIEFRAGDVEDMLVKINLALRTKKGTQTQVRGCMDRMMEIYQRPAAARTAYV